MKQNQSKQKSNTSKKPVSIKHSNSVKSILQAKLKVGAPNDKYEQEADRVADQVMRMPASVQSSSINSSPTSNINNIQRKCNGCAKNDELIQKKSSGITPEVTPIINSNIQSLQGRGQPLSQSERRFFEPRFGTDFSHVRLHTGNHAASIAQSINARAFTLGNNIVFGAGEYSTGKKKLMAHELTHIRQQNKLAIIQREEDTKNNDSTTEKKETRLQGFQEFVYKKAKENLDEKKLEGYAEKLSDAASNAIIDYIKEHQSDIDLTDKAQLLGITIASKFDMEKAINDLMTSPKATIFKSLILNKIKMNPAAALAATLAGLAALYLTGEKVPVKKLGRVNIEVGLKAKSITDLSLKEAILSIDYVAEKFTLGINSSIEFSKEDNTPKTALDPSGMIVGLKKTSIPDTTIEPNKIVKLKFGPTLSLKNFKLGLASTFDSSKGWGGQLSLRIGDEKAFLKSAFTLGNSNDLKFELDAKSPFKLKNLNVKAALIYNYESKVLTSIGINSQFTIHPKKGIDLLYLGFQLSGQRQDNTGQASPIRIEGLLSLGARF